MMNFTHLVNYVLFANFISFTLIAEVKTTADPEVYITGKVVEVDSKIFQLEDGSTWQITDPSISVVEGEKLRINLFNGDGSWHFTKISPEISASLVAGSESRKIKQVQYVYWAGEVQPLVTLMDGSQWLFDEFSISHVIFWNPEDYVLIFNASNNYQMYNITQNSIGAIVLYTIADSYQIQ